MVKNDLIERYVYAVTKYMKADLKKDVSAELETIIQDMLEERCGDVMPTEHDIRVVLTELGTPAELASKYKSETQDCLIGQPYYNLYVYVLKIVTACVIGGMLLAQIMAAVISHTIWYIAIFRIIGGIFGGVLTGFAFVTLLFAFFYKRGIKVEGLSNGIDNLPPVPQKTNQISKADSIIGIIFSVIFTLVFLVCPQIICIAFVKNGVSVYEPLFNLEYIRQTCLLYTSSVYKRQVYGRWLAKKWGIDPKAETPAVKYNDGKDFVPTNGWTVFSHQFSSIAGAGPVTGAIQAAAFGWLPVLLWILIGGVFFGAVTDFGALYASVKNEGKSMGMIIEKYIGKFGRKIFLLFCWLFTLIVIAAFADRCV